ncbi:MAG: 4-hydroxy-2-oxo-heptane-1,7-dioate aldolase [Verrucomicrobia subdivision 3 bacterium]|nr:4-hydroxy-2-oxo-heptane-1,7-dioate aldolase [Limisphaerales bacterium]MCS1412655.1 4-hydroxy-2-oxo-heptane-1,7-dioate aldolase [Limisphaerales bacterium]
MGAHGVLLFLARSAEDVERGFRFGRDLPRETRSVGGGRAIKRGLGFQDYLKIANEEMLIIPLIEPREALDDIERILKDRGIGSGLR